jgi:predicted acylesterase/phospholipase RssA
MPTASQQSLKALAEAIAAHRAELGHAARVCFLLQPGGAAGAYQAGALAALSGRGVHPDLIVGTSVGALNGLGLLLDRLVPHPARGPWPRTRLGRLWRRLSHRQEGAALLLDKPALVGWMSGRPDWHHHWLGGLASHLPQLGAELQALHGGVFTATRLRAFLTEAIGGTLHEPRGCTPDRAGRALSEAWGLAASRGAEPPTMILTATRVGTHSAVPFVLGDPAVARRLFARRHPVQMLGHETLVDEALIEAFVASASIPGVMPPVDLPLPGVSEAYRTFVDGAVANSEPFHMAIDAGATFIVSLEVSSSRSGPPQAGAPFPAIAAETFMTVQDRYYATELREVARWNRHVTEAQGPTSVSSKHVVPIYRLAPHRREIGLLEFDGRWDDGKLTCSLFDWYMAGYADAGGASPQAWQAYEQGREAHRDTGWALTPRSPAHFWNATYDPAPTHHEASPADAPAAS